MSLLLLQEIYKNDIFKHKVNFILTMYQSINLVMTLETDANQILCFKNLQLQEKDIGHIWRQISVIWYKTQIRICILYQGSGNM